MARAWSRRRRNAPIVLAAGIPRSGSTWLYNVARLLLASRFGSAYACWIDDLDETALAAADAAVVKLHEPCDALADRATVVMTTHRDLRDIAVSLRSLNGAEFDDAQMIASAAHARALHDHWSSRAKLDLAYRDIATSPASQVRRVGEALGLMVDEDDAREIVDAVDELPSPTDRRLKHDPTSLLHVNHRTDGRPGRWRGELSDETAEAITSAGIDWLRRRGYEP